MAQQRVMKLRGTAAALAAALFGVVAMGAGRDAATADDPGVERAREQVKMIDALYKNAVVSVTNRYESPPAVKVAKDVFAAMEKAGFHKAKLVDASGEPQNEANLPQTPFEKRAAKEIQSGKAYYDEVVGEGTDRTLFAATIVPAVTKKCATCHGAKEGDLLGFIRYEVPVK